MTNLQDLLQKWDTVNSRGIEFATKIVNNTVRTEFTEGRNTFEMHPKFIIIERWTLGSIRPQQRNTTKSEEEATIRYFGKLPTNISSL